MEEGFSWTDLPFLLFLGGSLSIQASTLQNKGRLPLAGADTATVCPCVPMGTRTTGGAKETRTPSPLLSPPPSLNEPAPERSFLDPKKRISWCSFYPVPLNDVSDTTSSPRPLPCYSSEFLLCCVAAGAGMGMQSYDCPITLPYCRVTPTAGSLPAPAASHQHVTVSPGGLPTGLSSIPLCVLLHQLGAGPQEPCRRLGLGNHPHITCPCHLQHHPASRK